MKNEEISTNGPQGHEKAAASSLNETLTVSVCPGAFVETKHGKTHYILRGPENGPLVVFSHGVSLFCFVWMKLAEQFNKKGFRVLIYDILFHFYENKLPLFFIINLDSGLWFIQRNRNGISYLIVWNWIKMNDIFLKKSTLIYWKNTKKKAYSLTPFDTFLWTWIQLLSFSELYTRFVSDATGRSIDQSEFDSSREEIHFSGTFNGRYTQKK